MKEADTRIEFSYLHTLLSGEHIGETYGYLPQLGAGVSLALSDRSRIFMSLHYGRKSGDPYWDVPSFSGPNITVQNVPLMFGAKTNASSRHSYRLYFGAAMQLTYLKEKTYTADSYGNPLEENATGWATGYYFFVAPEFPLSKNGNALGCELAWGGSKGTVRASHQSHGVDLSGFNMRLYYSLDL